MIVSDENKVFTFTYRGRFLCNLVDLPSSLASEPWEASLFPSGLICERRALLVAMRTEVRGYSSPIGLSNKM